MANTKKMEDKTERKKAKRAARKKTKTEKVELKKYNPALRRHTLHREIK